MCAKNMQIEADNQTFFVANPESDKSNSDSVEEARCMSDLGKSLGLHAQNEDEVANALADLHTEKEDATKRARARGKRGRNKRN